MDACKAFRERLLKRVMADASFEEGEATPEFLADQPEPPPSLSRNTSAPNAPPSSPSPLRSASPTSAPTKPSGVTAPVGSTFTAVRSGETTP
ncbi:hypothetical protein TeGR_g10613 [Tetraparma gracilis]|uniref:Uncharacterized protein n=1 Tax=Tetraparma gracilis TaxID=2962635 RepID=A0ABQ6NBX7_9STRA|nr:hypothetical protein TeGR_g10613 [Tetraparma gracilis]